MAAQIRSGLPVPFGRLREINPRKAKSRQLLIAERKALRRHRGPRIVTGQPRLISPLPRSCIRNQSQENLLERTKIDLALPSYNRQRLSGIGRGWCPSRSQKLHTGSKKVVRSDSGVAHRLSLSARVVSAADSQVKAKRQGRKHLWRLQNRQLSPFDADTKSGASGPE